MAESSDRMNRRHFLRRLGQGAAAAAVTAPWLSARAQEDAALQALIDQNQRSDFGQGFDSASRNIHMPQASLPTLSASTADTTEQAIARYEAIVANGGWPMVPAADRLRIGKRHPSVSALRQRLAAAGDLEANAGAGEVFDSYVEAAVRRFQARHGLGVDGVVRE